MRLFAYVVNRRRMPVFGDNFDHKFSLSGTDMVWKSTSVAG